MGSAILSLILLTILFTPTLVKAGGITNTLEEVGKPILTLPGAKTAGESQLPTIIGNVINFFLGFLGIVALVLIIYGGFLWMTARGNEDQVKKARDLLVQAVIGLIIILSAYAIASYVISNIASTIGAGTV